MIQGEHNTAWVICGDLNEVRSAEERKGSVFDPTGAHTFNIFINFLGLADINPGQFAPSLDQHPSISLTLGWVIRIYRKWSIARG